MHSDPQSIEGIQECFEEKQRVSSYQIRIIDAEQIVGSLTLTPITPCRKYEKKANENPLISKSYDSPTILQINLKKNCFIFLTTLSCFKTGLDAQCYDLLKDLGAMYLRIIMNM